jgi:hypothetical protein
MGISAKSLAGSQVIALTRLFSSGVLRELGRRGQSSLFTRLIRESRIVPIISSCGLVRDAFATAFEFLKRSSNRSEYIYKAALTEKVLLGRHSLKTAAMLTEFRVGNCKADLAILNGTSTVYEIKSERDRLDRLRAQIAAYRQVFAVVNVITGENHLRETFSSIPADVGVLLLSDRFQISVLREGKENPKRIVPAVVFGSLQLREARLILELSGIEVPDVPNTQAHRILLERFMKLAPEQVHEGMVNVLRETRSLLPLEDLIDDLPLSIRAAAFSTALRRADYPRLLTALNTPFRKALMWA